MKIGENGVHLLRDKCWLEAVVDKNDVSLAKNPGNTKTWFIFLQTAANEEFQSLYKSGKTLPECS